MILAEYKPSISEVLSNCGADIPDDGDGWVSIACPFHDDSHNSATYNETEGVFKCFGCDVSGDAIGVLSKAYDLTPEDARKRLDEWQVGRVPVQRAPAQLKRSTKGRDLLLEAMQHYEDDLDIASDYLKSRGITRTAAKAARLGVVDTPVMGHEMYRGRLSIPYLTTSGVVGMKFRCMSTHNCKDEGHAKYLTLMQDTRMYHVTSVLTTRSYLAVTEGEIDALVLNYLCDIPAVGIPGANNWKPHFARVLEGFDRIFVIGDGDKAGQEFARNVSKKLDAALPVVMPDGMDVNDVYLADGAVGVMNQLGV
jgi:DNA primase